MRELRLGLVVFIALTTAVLSHAQTPATAVVSGTVTDPTQAVVPSAEVVLTDAGTNVSRSQATNAAGQYVFVNVAPGVYRLAVTAQGFRQAVVPSLKVEVAKSYTVNFALEVGPVAEVVEVAAGVRAELQTTDATVGNVIPFSGLLRLPNINRRADTLMALQPATIPYSGSTATGGNVAGARSDQNTVSVDGGDSSDNVIGGGANSFAPVIPVPVDTVEEFRVGVTNPNATFGRSAGGQAAIIRKRGGNEFHGSSYWYHQNDNLNSTLWQNNRTLGTTITDPELRKKVQKPELKDNRFGGTVGGPIFKEKTFFFASYEGRRFPRTSDFSRIVPSQLLRQGILQFRDDTGTIRQYDLSTAAVCGTGTDAAPATGVCDPRSLGINPQVQATWNLMPLPNDLSGGDGLNRQLFRGNAASGLREDFGLLRVDHHLSPNWRFEGSFTAYRQIQESITQIDLRQSTGGPKGSGPQPSRPRYLVGALTGQVKPNLTNEFRFIWQQDRLQFDRKSPAPLPEVAGQDMALDMFSTTLDEPIDVDTQRARTQARTFKTYQFIDNLTWVKGRHTLLAGTSIRHFTSFDLRNDKVIGSLTSLVATIRDGTFITIPSTTRPPTCRTDDPATPANEATTIDCVRSADLTSWNNLYTSALGMVDNISVLLTRDGSLAALPFGTPLIANSKLDAYEFYVSDTWRIRTSLTVTFGLNYQWQTPPVERAGKQTFVIDNTTGQIINTFDYISQKDTAGRQGSIFNPQIGYVPIEGSGRSRIFDTDYGNWSPRLAAAWNPSYQSGFLGRLFGDRKTVIRGGYSLVYDRLNTVQTIIIPQLGVGFAQTLSVTGPNCDASGPGGPGCNPAGTDPASAFRVQVDGSTPLPVDPGATSPIVPTGTFAELLSFQVDPELKVPRNHNFDVTVQRELPGNMILEVGYIGRYAERLFANYNLNNIFYNFTDSASGQSFAQAFDAVAIQLRAGVAVTPQPFFENQLVPSSLDPAATSCSDPVLGGSCTAFMGSNFTNEFVTGLLQDLWLGGIDFFLASPLHNLQALELLMRASKGRSNYNAAIVTLRKRPSHGLSFDLNYTLSRSHDNESRVQNNAGQQANSVDIETGYGRSTFDRLHTFNALWQYDFPFGHGRRFSSGNWADKIVEGWYIAGIYSHLGGLADSVFQSNQVWGGSSLLPTSSGAIPTVKPNFGNEVHHNVSGSGGVGTSGDPATGGTGLNLFANPEAVANSFRQILISQDGRTGKGVIRDHPYWNLDLSIGKQTTVTETVKISFSFDFLNVFNHVNFNVPSTSPFTSPQAFGVISSQNTSFDGGPRRIQFGFRVDF